MGLAHDSGDCSERICPYDFAWVDKPTKLGLHHKYAECSNRGICDRDNGECVCFDGYEGKSCQRTKCPNDCSGHGKCAYIEDGYYGTVRNDLISNEGYEYTVDPTTFSYYQWDKTKTRGCICDPEYGDVDCSKRMCQYATDVMDQRADLTTPAKYQVQKILLQADDNTCYSQGAKTFALVFTSKLNETFTTQPITFESSLTGCHQFVLDVQNALLKLPNKVIDGVEVQASCGQGSPCQTYLNVTFTGNSVQGNQYPLSVMIRKQSDGCYPLITGLELAPTTQNMSVIQNSDFNSYECGRRGKCDYETGICKCFEGYTGLGCNVMTTLV